MVCGFHAVGLQMTLVNHSWLVLRKRETSYLTGWAHIMWQEFPSNPYIPKIWLLILPSSCYTFPCILVLKIWFLIKETTFMSYVWIFLSPVCWIMYRYCWEKLYVNHIKKMYIIANHSWIVGRVLMTGIHHKREGPLMQSLKQRCKGKISTKSIQRRCLHQIFLSSTICTRNLFEQAWFSKSEQLKFSQ